LYCKQPKNNGSCILSKMGFGFYDVTFGGKYTDYFKHVIASQK